jgi:hypothetical protein
MLRDKRESDKFFDTRASPGNVIETDEHKGKFKEW